MSLKQSGVDGLFYDNLREEAEPWVDNPAQDTLTGEKGTTFIIPPGDGRILEPAP